MIRALFRRCLDEDPGSSDSDGDSDNGDDGGDPDGQWLVNALQIADVELQNERLMGAVVRIWQGVTLGPQPPRQQILAV